MKDKVWWVCDDCGHVHRRFCEDEMCVCPHCGSRKVRVFRPTGG